MITARHKVPHLPFHAPVESDHHGYGAVCLVLAEGEAIVRRHRDGGAVDERRPDVIVLVALVDGRDDGGVSDLLVVIGGVDFHSVVVDADLGVGVVGVDGDLQGCGDDVGGGDGEIEDSGVLEGEGGFLGLETGPDEEDGQQDDEGENEEPCAEAAGDFSWPKDVVMVMFVA